VREFVTAGKIVAALCAGPIVLQAAGVLSGRRYTSHPACRAELTVGEWLDQPVVRDGSLVTSQAPGTAMAFALALIETLETPATARQVAAGLVYRD
jgi:putative intracellular protease/amidase